MLYFWAFCFLIPLPSRFYICYYLFLILYIRF
nr:MAG TPA: hypothetical protein [Caudoviricetes sp.]